MARILIADDHDVVRRGIRMLLQVRPEWEVCGEARNGREAVEMAKELTPDIIILDVSMPVLGGLGAADDILRINSEIKILIFTMDESKTLHTLVQRCGARGLVVKSQASEMLVHAIDRLLAGATFFSPIDEMSVIA